MADDTIAATVKGREAIIRASTDIQTMDVHVLVACLTSDTDEHTMLSLVTTIRTRNPHLRFIDVKYVAEAVARLVKAGYLKYSGTPLPNVRKHNLRGKVRRNANERRQQYA